MSDYTHLGFNTRAIHAGQSPDPATGAVVPSISQTSTFAQDGIGNLRAGYDYSRAGNPTRDALQTQLAAVEHAKHAISFASGLAAEDALVRGVLKPGDHIVLGNDVYGGSYRLITKILAQWGITYSTADMASVQSISAAVRPETRMFWLETPSNPMMKITDIKATAALAQSAGALLLVDNTFASPYLQNPLDLGADIVVHSTTKYIGGHSDVVGGAVVLNDDELAEKIRFIQFAAGAVSGPMDAFLTTRGLKTLGVRMEQHCANALQIAQWLAVQPGVERVLYPGLAEHPGHELAAAQMRGFGGMISVQFAQSGSLDGAAVARKVAESTHLFTLAESLGGIESLMNYPSEMTHASVKGTELAVPENLLRLSVGIEDAADLVADLDAAMR